ncbi:hypothetical protein HDU97_000836 [Phlyctochytrium planicorne]|nr:hypothetical protein HDU97_000836 [Phlyctochytrium planicorne]
MFSFGQQSKPVERYNMEIHRASAEPQEPQNSGAKESQAQKSFARGRINLEEAPPWQKEDAIKKQKAQQEIQDALRRQIMEREAAKAQEIERRKEEERREMERIQQEQIQIEQRYKIEQEEARRKQEEKQAEEKKRIEEKLERERRSMEELRKQSLTDSRTDLRERQSEERQWVTNQTSQNQVSQQTVPAPTAATSVSPILPINRSNSPPIPTLRKKPATPEVREPLKPKTQNSDPPISGNYETARGRSQTPGKRLLPEASTVAASINVNEILDQLLQIQHELGEEDRKARENMSTLFKAKAKPPHAPELPKLEDQKRATGRQRSNLPRLETHVSSPLSDTLQLHQERHQQPQHKAAEAILENFIKDELDFFGRHSPESKSRHKSGTTRNLLRELDKASLKSKSTLIYFNGGNVDTSEFTRGDSRQSTASARDMTSRSRRRLRDSETDSDGLDVEEVEAMNHKRLQRLLDLENNYFRNIVA